MHRRDLLTAVPLIGLGAALAPRPAAAASHDVPDLPAAQRFRVGEFTVTALSDGALRIGPEALQGIDAEGYAELMQAAFRDPDRYRSAVNGFLVQRGGEAMLVDAGTGGAMGPDLGRLLGNLRAAGVSPEDVTTLFVTHLHPDHIGGAVDGGAAVFPNAELVLSEAERAFWSDDGLRAQAPEDMQMFIDLAQATLASYSDRLRLFDGEAEVASGISSLPLPGHTPGHTGFVLGSGSESLLIWADIVHVPPVQFARPDVTIVFDVDPSMAADTRAKIMDRAAADRLMVAGMHMTFPGLAHLEAAGEGYRPVAAAWDYMDG